MYRYLVLISFLLISCSDKEVTISYENGKAKEIYYVDDDNKKDGLYKMFREDGTLQEESNYKSDVLHGKRKLYYPNGTQVEIEELYKDGSMEGEHFVYYPSGKLMIETNYSDNKMNGLFTKYFETGEIMETITFKDNHEMGPFEEYYANGKVQWKGTYLNGDKEFGLLQQFDEQGQLIKKMMCDSLGVCQTIWTPEKGDIVPEKLNLGKS